ncbi:class C beta-lactamase [Dongia sp.]|uniref:class C beta-lactamase n=1 Tax=Dongia sp. TaxID=1977262 RepID=UPI003750E41A
MINRRQWLLLAGSLSTLTLGRIGRAFAANADEPATVKAAIDAAVKPVMAQYGIPGMAVGVTIDGRRHFAEFGSASPKQKLPVTRATLFELGSISKTFTATLAALAEIDGKLKLTDTVGEHISELKGSPIGAVRLFDLATHTPGGFPLQLPENVKTRDQLMGWYRAWKPEFPAGTKRTYANPSVALLGIVTARAMGESFAQLADGRLFPALGLTRTFVNLLDAKAYAWGTNKDGKPVRAGRGPIAAEAWGVVSTSDDMLRYLEVSMGVGAPVQDAVARAVAATHVGYYRSGPFIQDLIWEQYAMPVALQAMTEGNSQQMSMKANPTTAITPPMPPRSDIIFNKTGSTSGFGAYLFAAPEQKLGIVLLANRFYPNEVRTKIAWSVMERLAT